MTALLHYAILKSARDRSLFIFLLGPMLIMVAILIGTAGATWQHTAIHYPVRLGTDFKPEQSAEVASGLATGFAIMFSAVAGFWTFRPEVATKAIGSFCMAQRPIRITTTLIAFATLLGIVGWIGSLTAVSLLTAALPSNLGFLALATAVGSLTGASGGAMMLTISSQPSAIAGFFIGVAFCLPAVISAQRSQVMIAALVVTIVCTAVCTFLLERRCAS